MNPAGTATLLTDELRSICGAEHIIEDHNELNCNWVRGMAPAVAVSPSGAAEIALVLRLANERGANVVPVGALTRKPTTAYEPSGMWALLSKERDKQSLPSTAQEIIGSPSPNALVLLNTSRLAEVEHYDPGDLTVGIGAGCTVAQLSSMVAVDGLLFAGDPPLPERTSVGGLLATGISGPLRHGYGGLRDYCIGIRFVTGDGRQGKGGGRVVKNVAGYDMMKLLIGSQGTLAVITGASFKLFPAPRQTLTFVAGFASAAEALKFRDAVLRSPLSPICLELVSPGALRKTSSDLGFPCEWLIAVRASGTEAVLARYRTELGVSVTHELSGERETCFWQAVQNFCLHELSEAELRGAHVFRGMLPVISIYVPVAEVGHVIQQLEGMMTPSVVSMMLVGRVGVGHLLVALNAEHLELPRSFHVDILDKLRDSLSPHASMFLERGTHKRGMWPMTPTHSDSMRAVKRALDPQDILNRGRFPV